MTVAAAGAVAERKVVHRLMRADASSPAMATALEGLNWLQTRRLERLIRRGVVCEAGPGRYYLSLPALADRQDARRHAVALALVLVTLLMGIALYLTATRP